MIWNEVFVVYLKVLSHTYVEGQQLWRTSG